jgi:hypothetical protein
MKKRNRRSAKEVGIYRRINSGHLFKNFTGALGAKALLSSLREGDGLDSFQGRHCRMFAIFTIGIDAMLKLC